MALCENAEVTGGRLVLEGRLRLCQVAAAARLVTKRRLGTPPTVGASSHGVRVSMTTYPPRVASAAMTLESILSGRRRPDAVTVVLARSQFGGQVPGELRQLCDRGVEILWTGCDLRSYKKLLPTIAAHPDQVIVTADDDCLYPRWWLDRLVVAHEHQPQAILGLRGERIQVSGRRFAPYRSWPRATSHTPANLTLLTGIGGILYPPGRLPAQVTDSETALRLAPTADDLWFKAMALLGGVATRMATDEALDYPPTFGNRDARGLAATNVDGGANERQFAALLDHFELWERLTADSGA